MEMAKFDKQTIELWTGYAREWLAFKGLTLDQIETGADAWAVASRSGILQNAYKDASVVDAHIQTALQTIMPNAVFKDSKRY